MQIAQPTGGGSGRSKERFQTRTAARWQPKRGSERRWNRPDGKSRPAASGVDLAHTFQLISAPPCAKR
jgi:hypothetical protein